jgi:hypothetical protein
MSVEAQRPGFPGWWSHWWQRGFHLGARLRRDWHQRRHQRRYQRQRTGWSGLRRVEGLLLRFQSRQDGFQTEVERLQARVAALEAALPRTVAASQE